MALHSGQRRGLRGTLVALNTGVKQKLRAGWALRSEGDNGYLLICVPDTWDERPCRKKEEMLLQGAKCFVLSIHSPGSSIFQAHTLKKSTPQRTAMSKPWFILRGPAHWLKDQIL